MASYNLIGKYESILSSLSNDLTVQESKRVSKSEVLKRILDIVIEEERLFASNDSEQPVSFFRRNIYKLPINNTIHKQSSQDIINRVKAISKKLD